MDQAANANGTACECEKELKAVLKTCSGEADWKESEIELREKAKVNQCVVPDSGATADAVFGVFMNAFGCLSNVFGLNMVRLAHTKVKAAQLAGGMQDKQGCLPPAAGLWEWWVGWLFTIVMTAAFDGVSFAFAPLEIVACMSGFSVLINMLMAQKVNGEPLLPIDGMISMLIIPGIILTVTFGPKESAHVTPGMVCRHATRRGYLLFECFMMTVAVLFQYLSALVYARPTPDSYAPDLTFAAKHKFFGGMRSLTFNFMGGLFGAHQALCSKLLLECLKTSLGGENIWLTPTPWMILPVLLVMLVIQLKNMDNGMAAEGALVSVPLFNAMFLLNTTSLSAVFFGSLDSLDLVHSLFFFCGCSMVMGGTILVLKRPITEEEDLTASTIAPGATAPSDPLVWFHEQELGAYSSAMMKSLENAEYTPEERAQMIKSMTKGELREFIKALEVHYHVEPTAPWSKEAAQGGARAVAPSPGGRAAVGIAPSAVVNPVAHAGGVEAVGDDLSSQVSRDEEEIAMEILRRRRTQHE